MTQPAEIYKENSSKPRLIVSFTSFPARIPYIPKMLETIYQQTLPADEVILWLSEEEFPEKEAELTTELREYAAEGKLTIRWCPGNLKSHKKYFYICQERPNDIIVTIDDDLLYPPELLQNLYESYLNYPKAISATRVHLIPVTEEGKILPYQMWFKEADAALRRPSLHLLATSGAGTLFPPHILPQETFDAQAIQETCLSADDLWLKTMELYADIPVVLVAEHPGLHYVKGTQEISLYLQNKIPTGNDLQLENIRNWTRERLGLDVWKEKLLHPTAGESLYGVEAVCEIAMGQIRKYTLKVKNANHEKKELRVKYKRVCKERTELKEKLQQADREKFELNEKLQQAIREKSELNEKLQKIHQDNMQREETIQDMENHFLVKLDQKLHRK